MKQTFTLLFALVAFFLNSSAQAGAIGPKVFKPLMSLTMQSVPNSVGTAKVLNGNLYFTGAFTGIAAQYYNGQVIGLNGIMCFPQCNLSDPQRIGPSSLYRTYDVDWFDGTEWVVGEDYGNEKLFKHDVTSNSWAPQGVTTDSGTIVRFIQKINDSTALLLGSFNYCNGVAVSKGCLYNLNSGVVTPLNSGGFGTDNAPRHVYRSSDGILFIGCESGVATYNTNTFTLKKLPINMPTSKCIGHGDTVYTVVYSSIGGSVGDVLFRRIGNGDFEVLCYTKLQSIAGLNFVDGKIHIYGNYTSLFLADSSQHAGTDLAFNEATTTVDPSGISTVHGMFDYIQLPNGEYFGWNNGDLFTTQTLISGIKEEATTMFKVYPNPTTDYVVIENIPNNATVTLTNTTGQLVSTHIATGDKLVIPTQDLTPGIYFGSMNGKTFKVLKQ